MPGRVEFHAPFQIGGYMGKWSEKREPSCVKGGFARLQNSPTT